MSWIQDVGIAIVVLYYLGPVLGDVAKGVRKWAERRRGSTVHIEITGRSEDALRAIVDAAKPPAVPKPEDEADTEAAD